MIPGFLVSLVSFPGVIVHSVAHRMFCDLAKVPVYKAVYYQLFSPYGYVEHGDATDLKTSFLITVGPFLVSSLLCAVLSLPLILRMTFLKDYSVFWSWLPLTQFWFAVSIGMHAFPGKQDLDNFQAQIRGGGGSPPLYLLSCGLRIFFVLARFGKFFWFDAIYALLITFFTPLILCWSFQP